MHAGSLRGDLLLKGILLEALRESAEVDAVRS